MSTRTKVSVPFADGFEDVSKFGTIKVDCVCWPESFPYKPEVSADIAHSDQALLIRFSVSEKDAKAVCREPNGPVWEDSCVEFFVRVPGQEHYYNFETSCAGVGLAAKRLSRQDFSHFGPDEMKRISRRTTWKEGNNNWELELEIPFAVLGLDHCPDTLEANFYKCGDKTAEPHFLSWSPVRTATPDFHRPEFFGILELEPCSGACGKERPGSGPDLRGTAARFIPAENIVSVAPLGNGLINDTYKVTTANGPDYVLQRINNAIFKDVDLLQRNIVAVTGHLRAKGEKTLTFIPATDGCGTRTYALVDGLYWRMSEFMEDAVTREAVTPESSRLCGKAFGRFESMLTDLETPLGETIPDFHNIELRVRQLEEAAAADGAGRMASAEVQEILAYLRSLADEMCLSERLYRQGLLPKRICHCDTKVNNMMFDAAGNVICVIDLDTVMPSFVFSDYGDFLRTAANFVAEDDPEIGKVGFNMDIFRAFTAGYLESASAFLTPVEKDNLPYAACLFPYMQAVRFFADYLNGDTYYKIKYPEHNLVRTRNQVALLRSALSHMDEMKEFIAGL